MIKFILFFLISSFLYAEDKVIARSYFVEFMGHVHKSPSDLSESLTAIQCAQSVSILEDKESKLGWLKVNVGEDTGYIREIFLNSKRPNCFQENYPKFYQNQNFDMTQLYFWGRIEDHFIRGESKAL